MTIDPNTEPLEIIKMALEREKEAYAFYKEAAEAAQHPAAKATLLEMAAEEKQHIRQLEEVLDKHFYQDN